MEERAIPSTGGGVLKDGALLAKHLQDWPSGNRIAIAAVVRHRRA